MRFNLKAGRTNKPNRANLFPDGAQHPDLPLSPKPRSSSPPAEEPHIPRRATTSERFSSGYAGDRRSIAVEPGYDPSLPFSPDDVHHHEPVHLGGGLSRAQTILRREGGVRRADNHHKGNAEVSPLWAPDTARLPTPDEAEQQQYFMPDGGGPMHQYPGKTSTESSQSAAGSDRWQARKLQRQQAEAGFREQRQAGLGLLYSQPAMLSEHSTYTNNSNSIANAVAAASYTTPAEQQHQQPQQPHFYNNPPAHPPPASAAYHIERTAPTNANAGSSGIHNPQPVSSSSSRPSNYAAARHDTSPQYILSSTQHHHQQYAPADSALPTISPDAFHTAAPHNVSPQLPQLPQPQTQQHHNHQQPGAGEEAPMSSTNNGSLPTPKLARSGGSNRQSVHNGLNVREASVLGAAQQTGGQQQGGGAPAFNASVVPPANQPPPYQGSTPTPQPGGDVTRIKTPQPVQTSEDMTSDEINQLIKDHKELREKYTKVKKYYFEKEDQVKQLQNSLAHQRLSQSRTSLDDSEYTTRFNRLDGLIAQLAFAIRKSWRSVPPWLMSSVNKDAVSIGKQEMTAAGRAFIACWIVEEVFEKFFHPDLDATLSSHLKSIQRNIRRFAPFAQTAEEEEYLTSKVVNWRLSTLEGLQEDLRSPQCAVNRAKLTDSLKRELVGSLSAHLHEPAPPDLEGGVHMIIELVVSIASHLPLESRDVVIEYFQPGFSILYDQMKLESGIPALTVSIADEANEHLADTDDGGDSDDMDGTDPGEQSARKKANNMLNTLSALTGAGGGGTKSKSSGGPPEQQQQQQQRKNSGAGHNPTSRPESAQGMRLDQVPRVRMAAGIGVQIRGRSVLVKAPVFTTN